MTTLVSRRSLRATGLLAALALAAPAAAGPPSAGVLVPGRTLGGIALGATKAEVERRWGRAYGVCRGCAHETWYFNQYAFRPQGAGVELRNGRVAAVFTLYQPLAWRTTKDLRIGEPALRITTVYGALVRKECAGYYVLVLPGPRATTAFYVLDDRLWAFGLSRPGLPLCR
jgi:hypothetical protein